MEHLKNFANLAEILSAKFPEITEQVFLYLLAFVAQKHPFLRENFIASQYLYENLFDRQILLEIDKINSLDIENFSKSEIKLLCSFLIKEFLQNNPVYSPIPKKINELLIEIADPQPSQRILHLDYGIGNLFVEFQKEFPNHGLIFLGTETGRIKNFLREINLFINDVDYVKISSSDPISNTLAFLNESTESNRGKGVDIAISVLPFNPVLQRDQLNAELFSWSRNMKNISQEPYVELMLRTLNDNGRGIAIVKEEFLYANDKSGWDFREFLLGDDLVESVISLPEDIFSSITPIKTSVVVFNKNKIKKGVVNFSGLSSKFESTDIKLENLLFTRLEFTGGSGSTRIKHLPTELRADKYALKSVVVNSILSNFPQEEIKRIEDLIVDKPILGYNYSPKNRIVENSDETLPYVRVTDLAKNDKDFTLDISKVERKISREKAHKRTIIDFSAVLVSKIAPKLKPTYFNFIGQPIVIGSDVIALKMKEDVNIEYFLTQLHSRLVQIQVEMMSSGNIINRISKEDFLNVQIILPSFEEQQRQILAMRGVIEEKVIAEEKLIYAQFDVVASINHSLKNKLAVIINDYDTLVRFLRRKERKSETIMFSDAISANAVGDDIDTIEIITDRLKTNLSDASKVFNNALKIQRQNLKKDGVELVKFFKEEVKPLYVGKNFSIEIIAKPNLKLNVWLDKDAFKDVIENLIENAKSHGFVDDEKNYRIVFDLSKLKDEEDFDEHTSTKYARIIYTNDGKPFPKNFSFEDYKQFSNKSGKTQGTGIGGYVINKIIELHDGRFNFISPSDDFTVEFEILLPLEN